MAKPKNPKAPQIDYYTLASQSANARGFLKRRAELAADIVQELVNQLNLKSLDMYAVSGGSAYQRTEKLLKDYVFYKETLKDYNVENPPETISAATVQACTFAVGLVDRAMDKVRGDKYLSALKMRYFEGYVIEEIADRYNISISTAHKHITRLINQMSLYIVPEQVLKETLGE